MSTPPGPSLTDRLLEWSVVGSFTRVGPWVRRRTEHWSEFGDLSGRVVLLTGATSGLGRAGANLLASKGARVVAVGRNEVALASLARDHPGLVEPYRCDVGDLDQAMALAEHARGLERLDAVIHNAGALTHDFSTTAHGVETTLAVHVLAPYLITRAIGDAAQFASGRVVVMTSGGMYTQRLDLTTLESTAPGYDGTTAYARAKRAQVVMVGALQRREPAGGRRFYAVHPGWAATPGVADSLPTFDRVLGPLLRSPEEGVDGALWLATTEPAPEGGGLWLDRAPRPAHRLARTRPSDEHAEGEALLAWLDDRLERAGF